MCWNNSGEYGVTPADITDTEAFPGKTPEASEEFKKPAIGTTMKPLFVREESDLSILDSILYPNYEDADGADFTENTVSNTVERRYLPFLQIQ